MTVTYTLTLLHFPKSESSRRQVLALRGADESRFNNCGARVGAFLASGLKIFGLKASEPPFLQVKSEMLFEGSIYLTLEHMLRLVPRTLNPNAPKTEPAKTSEGYEA